MAIPTIVASSGPFSTATTALTVTLPTHATGDRIWIAAAGPVATVSAPSGWTEDTNLFLSGSGAQTNVFYLDAASSSETNPVFAAPANHLIAVAITIRGGGAVDGYATATPTPATSVNLTGPNITTTAADTLLLAFVGSGFDTASNPITTLNSWGAATSTSIPVQGGTSLGNGSQVAIVKGESATAQTITGLDATRHTSTSGRYNVGVVALKAAGAGGITGTASITEDPDTVSATGVLPIIGTATVSEAPDTLSATGTLPIIGTASITEDADTLTATGSGAAPGIVGTASITEDPDTVSATGALRIAGTASITEGADTVTSTGALSIKGQASITEGADTSTATGVLPIKGVASITEDADTLSATGSLAAVGITGTASITEADDTVSATGRLAIRGTASINEAADTVTATATIQTVSTEVAIENRLFAPRIRRAFRSPDVVRHLDAPKVSRRLLSAEIARSLQAPAIKRKYYS